MATWSLTIMWFQSRRRLFYKSHIRRKQPTIVTPKLHQYTVCCKQLSGKHLDFNRVQINMSINWVYRWEIFQDSVKIKDGRKRNLWTSTIYCPMWRVHSNEYWQTAILTDQFAILQSLQLSPVSSLISGTSDKQYL